MLRGVVWLPSHSDCIAAFSRACSYRSLEPSRPEMDSLELGRGQLVARVGLDPG